MPRWTLTPEERFWSYVKKTDLCWLWTGSCHAKGYGHFWLDGKMTKAYRVAYELLVGPIPEGLVLDHLCRNPRCVNPNHLEPVTNRENLRRGLGTGRTHCPHGHAYTEANVYVNKNKNSRECRTCRRARQRRYKAERKAE